MSTRSGSISDRARQREGVTYSCVQAVQQEFYPIIIVFTRSDSDRTYSLHSLNLHTSPRGSDAAPRGHLWDLVRETCGSESGMFISHCVASIWECVTRHLTVTSLSLTNSQTVVTVQQWLILSKPTMETSVPWIFLKFFGASPSLGEDVQSVFGKQCYLVL